MFERFTERARQVVVYAQDEARSLDHNYIGTEHLLLGLLREEEGTAARVLESLDITVEEVRAQVLRVVGRGDGTPSGQIPFTPRAKKALELSLREALSLGHNHIGSEHILLALVRVRDGVAARILLDFDADPETIWSRVTRMLFGPGQPPAIWPEGIDPRPRALARPTGRESERPPTSAPGRLGPLRGRLRARPPRRLAHLGLIGAAPRAACDSRAQATCGPWRAV